MAAGAATAGEDARFVMGYRHYATLHNGSYSGRLAGAAPVSSSSVLALEGLTSVGTLAGPTGILLAAADGSGDNAAGPRQPAVPAAVRARLQTVLSNLETPITTSSSQPSYRFENRNQGLSARTRRGLHRSAVAVDIADGVLDLSSTPQVDRRYGFSCESSYVGHSKEEIGRKHIFLFPCFIRYFVFLHNSSIHPS